MNNEEIVKVRVLEVENEGNTLPYLLKYRSNLHPNDVIFEEKTELEPLSALQSRGVAMTEKEKETLKELQKSLLGGIDIEAEKARLDRLQKDLESDQSK